MVVTDRADFAVFVELIGKGNVSAPGALEQQALGYIGLFRVVICLVAVEPDLDH
jgi:hypothetical protein